MATRTSQPPTSTSATDVDDVKNDENSGDAGTANNPASDSSNVQGNSLLQQQLQIPADFVGDQLDHLLSKSNTYDHFLRIQLTELDLYFVRDESVAKQLVELGCRGYGEQFSKLEFDKKRAKLQKQKREHEAGMLRDIFNGLASEDADVSDSNILNALAERELDNRQGRISTVIFMRVRMPNNHEISVFCDYADRLASNHVEWQKIFNNRKPIRPRFRHDLSYHNWSTRVLKFNNTANFTILSTTDTITTDMPVHLRSKLSGQFVRLGPGVARHAPNANVGDVGAKQTKQSEKTSPNKQEQLQADVERHTFLPTPGTPEADYYIQFVLYDIIYHSHYYEADLETRRSVRALQASAFNQKRKQQLADQPASATNVVAAKDQHEGKVDASRAYTLNDFIKVLDLVDT